jgi:hypothetical protein
MQKLYDVLATPIAGESEDTKQLAEVLQKYRLAVKTWLEV